MSAAEDLFHAGMLLYDYKGVSESDLSARKGDRFILLRKIEGWWQVQLRAKIGYLPAAYCEDKGPYATQLLRAKFGYEAADSTVMSFAEGDIFDLVDASNAAWYKATNHRNDQTGYIPVSYVENYGPVVTHANSVGTHASKPGSTSFNPKDIATVQLKSTKNTQNIESMRNIDIVEDGIEIHSDVSGDETPSPHEQPSPSPAAPPEPRTPTSITSSDRRSGNSVMYQVARKSSVKHNLGTVDASTPPRQQPQPSLTPQKSNGFEGHSHIKDELNIKLQAPNLPTTPVMPSAAMSSESPRTAKKPLVPIPPKPGAKKPADQPMTQLATLELDENAEKVKPPAADKTNSELERLHAERTIIQHEHKQLLEELAHSEAQRKKAEEHIKALSEERKRTQESIQQALLAQTHLQGGKNPFNTNDAIVERELASCMARLSQIAGISSAQSL